MSHKRKHESDDEVDDLDRSERAYMSDEEGGIRIDNIYIPPPPKVANNFDFSTARLIITKIVNTNFKSYGGQQILGPFHKYFNTIVGPNGSGKSNVIDSMLFVFGYRASKIRSKKLSVLLHKSETYPNVQSCSVAVHFVQIRDKENDLDEYEEVPGTTLVVSRTVHKDNTSYYMLNGAKVQYKEVALLLRKHGVDLDHNRFLILQGEVEQISLMKPKAQNEHDTGMLEYLEDIIGTTRFKLPLNQLEEKIEVLSELRLEKVNRVKLAEREKDDLKEPMLEAVKFLELENEITKKKNFFLQKHLKEIEIKITENETEHSEISEICNAINEKLKSVTHEKKSHESTFHQQNEKYDTLIKQKEKYTEEFDKANNQDMIVQADIVQTNKRRKKVIETLKQERNKLEELKKIPSRNQRDIEDYEVREKQLSEQHETLEAERTKLLASLREDTIDLQEEKETLQTKLIDLRNVVDETKSTLALAESELKLLTSSEESEQNKLESLKKTFHDNKETLTQRTQLVKDIKQKIVLTEKSFKEAQSDLERVKNEEYNIIQEMKVMRVKIEESRSSMQASRSRGRVLDSLMQQKREGALPGLFGRLGDLGAIDQKYDVAISTACGPLDNIVVDTVDTAQWCIEFLKTHDIGRATFIALEKQEHLRRAANSPINTPENVYRLYDLIRIEDERVKTAFYYALRDTLVANDLDQASRIAYGAQRYRVVTLKGDLIETSGTMSGGGRTVLKGRMGQSVAVQTKIASPQKIMDMETSLEQLQQNANELRQRQLKLEDQVGTLQASLRTLKIDLEKYTIEIQSIQHEQPTLSEQLKKQEQKAKTACANPANIKKLQTDVDKKNEEYKKACVKSEELQTQVDKINKKIKDKTEKKMSIINKKIAECSEILEKCKAELVKLKVAIKTAERNTVKSTEKISNMEGEQTNLENRLIAMQAERKGIEADATVLLQNIEKITNELADEEESVSEARLIITKLTKSINEIKSEKLEADLKLKDIEKKLHENKRELPHYQSKIALLKLQQIPEQEFQELPTYSIAELLETDTKYMMNELKVQEEKLKAAKPNLTAIKEYRNKEQNYLNRVQDLDEITEKRNNMRDKKDEIRKKRQEEFHVGFRTISSKLKEMYQMITLGGDAELEMVDSYDPFSEGIVLNVRPPKKSWKNITNLSGGEKTLSSLALVFALHYYKPSPLYFMDEIDAALDFKNVSIVGNYIKERTKNAQFIIISLRNNMFELADYLVGIYKTKNITKCTVIKPRDFAEPLINIHISNGNDEFDNLKSNENGTIGDVSLENEVQSNRINERNNSNDSMDWI